MVLLLPLHTNKSHANKKEAMILTNHIFSVETTPIYNQNDIIKTIKDFVEIPVLFPTILKGEIGRVYFAYTDLQNNFKQGSPKTRYSINIGLIPGCSAHFCTLGYVNAELKGTLAPDYGLKHEGGKTTQVEIKKVSLKLAHNIQGYYTPGFVGASYIQPKIQWYYKDVLYTIQWNAADQKDLVQMANSAITAEQGKH